MKTIFLISLWFLIVSVAVFAEEVTFNDFEEITHESKPALRHKKTKEIYPITFSEKFYSPDKTMYAVFANAGSNKEDLRYCYVFNNNNHRIAVNQNPLTFPWDFFSEFAYWRNDFIIIKLSSFYGYYIYFNFRNGFEYSGGPSCLAYSNNIIDYWITDSEIWYMDFKDSDDGSGRSVQFYRFKIFKKYLLGKNNGKKELLFNFSDFYDHQIVNNTFPETIQKTGDLRRYNKPVTIEKRYFNHYPDKKDVLEKHNHTFSKIIKVSKSGKILSTTIPPDQFGVCLADNVRIRTSPDLNGTVVGHLKKDDTFEILDASESTQVIDTMEAYWYKIKTKTLTGWVYGYFIIGKPAENDQR